MVGLNFNQLYEAFLKHLDNRNKYADPYLSWRKSFVEKYPDMDVKLAFYLSNIIPALFDAVVENNIAVEKEIKAKKAK